MLDNSDKCFKFETIALKSRNMPQKCGGKRKF